MLQENLLAIQTAKKAIREYFYQTNTLEVTTDCLIPTGSSAPEIQQFHCEDYWLRTSPELAMQTLIWQGVGDIFQLGPAFRKNEEGSLHRSEFTLLEWYRTHKACLENLIEEMFSVCKLLLGNCSHQVMDYRALFISTLNFDPFLAGDETIKQQVKKISGRLDCQRADWLDQLLTHCIIPQIPSDQLIAICHYPPADQEFARMDLEASIPVARRAEIWFDQVELANGCEEIRSSSTLVERWQAENEQRMKADKTVMPLPQELLNAMKQHANPSDTRFAGAALGFDRLLMLSRGEKQLIRY